MRLLHTMLRVGDMERSIHFYTEVMGMRLLRRHEFPAGKFTLAFVGYTDEATGTVIELTHNWGVDQYELGTAFGHIAVAVEDAAAACDLIRQRGGKPMNLAHKVNSLNMGGHEGPWRKPRPKTGFQRAL